MRTGKEIERERIDTVPEWVPEKQPEREPQEAPKRKVKERELEPARK